MFKCFFIQLWGQEGGQLSLLSKAQGYMDIYFQKLTKIRLTNSNKN